MRLTVKLVVGCLFVACLVGSPWEEPVRAIKVVERSNDGNRPLRARAIVRDLTASRVKCFSYKRLVRVAQRRLPVRRQKASETFLNRAC